MRGIKSLLYEQNDWHLALYPCGKYFVTVMGFETEHIICRHRLATSWYDPVPGPIGPGSNPRKVTIFPQRYNANHLLHIY